MPINHISLATGPARFAAVRAFYLEVLAPLGYIAYYDRPGPGSMVLGLQPVGKPPDFWLHAGGGGGDPGARPGRTHVAFEVEGAAVVDRWYGGAIKAGGICNGPPGLRPQFSDPYYAAFVLDPLGNNIEAFHYATARAW